MQTRLQSLIEVSTGTLLGGVGSWLITYAILLLAEAYEWESKKLTAVATVAACTVWSLLRGYWLRRRFNRSRPVSFTKS